jgi:hypothetical protein
MSPIDVPKPSDAWDQALHDQTISDTEPGPILRDVATFLEFIEHHDGLRVSAKQRQLYNKRLPEINAQLSYPTDADYERPTQKAYPYVHGVYLLVRAAGLARVSEGGSHAQLVLRDDVVDTWQTLNSTERYMALLEAWIHRANADELMGDGRQMFTPLFRILQFASGLEEGEATFANDGDRERLDYHPGYAHLALMHLSGWVEVEEEGTAPQQPWAVHRVVLTPVGAAMLHRIARLMETVLEGDGPDPDRVLQDFLAPVEAVSFTNDQLHEAFAPYFPEWNEHLPKPHSAFESGVHTLRVWVDWAPYYDGSFEAHLTAPGDVLLDAVAEAILRAAQFDRDHLYQFSFDDAFGREQNVSFPIEGLEPPYTDAVRLGDLPLEDGSTLTFLYDFGDNWEFGLEVASITPNDDDQTDVHVRDVTDSTPEQYPH